MKKLLPNLFIILLASICYADEIINFDLCPVKRYIEPLSPKAISERFKGDTIFFIIPNADKVYFESFKLLTPDTLWIKERPTNKIPHEHKHFKLITNFSPVSGWGVNAHRQYTPGTSLEQTKFIFRGSHTENVQYLGTFNYILLEDASTGKLIKWDYTTNENKNMTIYSPSILRNLSLMKNQDFIVKKNDTTFIESKCVDVIFFITVRPKKLDININANFDGGTEFFTSHNWTPCYFLKKDASRIINKDSISKSL